MKKGTFIFLINSRSHFFGTLNFRIFAILNLCGCPMWFMVHCQMPMTNKLHINVETYFAPGLLKSQAAQVTSSISAEGCSRLVRIMLGYIAATSRWYIMGFSNLLGVSRKSVSIFLISSITFQTDKVIGIVTVSSSINI